MHSMMGTGEGPPKAYTWAPSSPLGGRHGSSTQAQQQQQQTAKGPNPYGPIHSYSSVLASPSSSNHTLAYTSLSSQHGGSSGYPPQMGHSMAGLDMGHSNPQAQGGYYTSPSMQTSPGAGGRAPLHRYTGPGAHAYNGGPYGGPSARNHQINFAMAMANGQDREDQPQQRPRGLSRSLVGEMNQVASTLLHHGGEQLEREEEKQLLMMNEKRNHFKRPDEGQSGSMVTFGGEANSWTGLDLSKMGLSLISRRLALYARHLTCLYLNDNRLTAIPDSVFDLKRLNKLDLSNNQIARLPPAIGRLVHLQELSLAGNKIRELPCEMGKLFRLKVLLLDGNPVTSPPPAILKQGVDATIIYLREKTPLPAPPPERPMIHVKTNTSSEYDTVRVLCYNVLAEKYAVPELLSYCPTRYLKYDHRKQQILKEIISHNCDFIALQEVEAGHYKSFFEPQMSKMGYGGTFRPKSRARTMMDGSSVDGCVLFHKTDKYKMLEEFWIEYQSNSLKRYEKEFPGSVEALDRLMTKDQIAVATVFRCIPPAELKTGKPDPKEKERIVVVVNTHIHWDPEYPDVKLMQVCMLMEELEAITTNNKRYSGAPFIICGDFNSMPDSGVYKYIREGRLESNHADFNGFDYGRYTRDGPRHPFRLASAYESIGEPAFTNFTGNFTGCLDYIFYSSDKLEVCKIMKPVDEDVVLGQTGALPNAYMCSDHIPLLSEFQYINPDAVAAAAENGGRLGWRREASPTLTSSSSSSSSAAAGVGLGYDSEDDEGLLADEEQPEAPTSGGSGRVYAPWASSSSGVHRTNAGAGSGSSDGYWSNDSDSDSGRFY